MMTPIAWQERALAQALFHAGGMGGGPVGRAPPGHTAFSWSPPEACRRPPSGACHIPGHTPYSCGHSALPTPHERYGALERVVCSLRRLERSVTFHRDLMVDVARVVGESSYSRDNFAYGSTPLPTWKRLLEQTAVCEAIDVCCSRTGPGGGRSPSPRHAVVFGASHGLLVMFTSLLSGVRCVGYEILPFLCRTARDVAADAGVPTSLCEFVLADMLTADVSAAGLVFLTSQCWDAGLRSAVARKLGAQLPPRAVVVDYQAGLDAACDAFRLADTMVGQVSWGDGLAFHIFQRW